VATSPQWQHPLKFVQNVKITPQKWPVNQCLMNGVYRPSYLLLQKVTKLDLYRVFVWFSYSRISIFWKKKNVEPPQKQVSYYSPTLYSNHFPLSPRWPLWKSSTELFFHLLSACFCTNHPWHIVTSASNDIPIGACKSSIANINVKASEWLARD